MRPKGPLEHLVADLVLNLILFLYLIQQEICNSRKNEDCFSLTICRDKYAGQGHLSLVNKNVPCVLLSHTLPGPP